VTGMLSFIAALCSIKVAGWFMYCSFFFQDWHLYNYS